MELFSMYWPLLLAALFFYVSFFFNIKEFTDKDEKVNTTIIIPPISFSLPIPISAFYSKGILFLIAIVFLVIVPITRDYTQFISERYSLVVSYDTEDIERALEDFSDSELDKMKIKQGWQTDKDVMLNKLDSKVVEYSTITKFKFSACRSIGETFCPIKKIGGLQKYRIPKSNGFLIHSLSLPDSKPYSFETKFHLIQPTKIKLNIFNIIKNSLIIELPYRQIASPKLSKKIYPCEIIAVTKISFLPLIEVGNTLYLIENENGYRIPIGFAENTRL